MPRLALRYAVLPQSSRADSYRGAGELACSLTEALRVARARDAEVTLIYLEPGIYCAPNEVFPIEIDGTVYISGQSGASISEMPVIAGDAEAIFQIPAWSKLVLSSVAIDGGGSSRGIEAEPNSILIARGCEFSRTTGSCWRHIRMGRLLQHKQLDPDMRQAGLYDQLLGFRRLQELDSLGHGQPHRFRRNIFMRPGRSRGRRQH